VANSTAVANPVKPRPDVPLFAHDTGRWAKKVRGKFCYFTRWADDPSGEAALHLWLDQRDEPLDGRTPRAASDGWCGEIRYFMECVAERKRPTVVTAAAAVRAIRVVEAEGRSIVSNRIEAPR
jgi:hypothetical protein